MAETATQADNKVAQGNVVVKDLVEGIKKELDVLVKPEPHECVICIVRSNDTYDIYATNTTATGISLHKFLLKFTNSNLAETQHSKYICKNCHDLVNLLEQAEIEYLKLKETFESILSKNPLFESQLVHPVQLESVKNEIQLGNNNQLHTYIEFNIDSEDEPLSIAKKKRHRKPKKKALATGRRKIKPKVPGNDSWDCDECGLVDQPGGKRAASAHKTEVHSMSQDEASDAIVDVKKEDTSDGSQTFINGFDSLPKIEFDDFPDDDDDDDNSSNYIPEEETPKPKKNRVGRPLKSKNSPVQKKTKKRERVIHKCDQCDAKYSSLARLEQHKLKHDGSKPPYICEVCGAHYKHKRACDIHIALHKGISDWKCEECNKLFPSKGALARHNNIHTGKLNYQCDLCGKSFIHTSSFKMHKLSHSGVKPHACDVCGLALMTRSHLKRHKRVHSGEKRHECTVCGKRFSERYNLAAHSKSHESPAGAVPPQPRRHLFRCPFCPDRFERRYMLERHTSVVHGRALERPPPTPRNTMSKLLKAQAARRPPAPAESDNKDDRSSDSRSTPVTTPQKLLAQLSGAGGASSWSSAYTEFNLRADFPH